MNKVTGYIIVFVFLLVVTLFTLVYYKGKRDASPPKADYPTGGNGIPAGWSPESLVKELYKVMDGLGTFSGTKDETWKKLRDLPTDDMVVAVYDVFNQNYFKEGEGTLTEWIVDESNYNWLSGVKESTLLRLSKLNLV